MQNPLSRKQVEVLRALESFARRRSYIPSVRELATKLKKSPTTVFQHLKALEKKGYIRSDGTAHGWVVVRSVTAGSSANEEADSVRVEVHGTIVAGAPLEAVEDRSESYTLPREFVPEGAFALKVSGDSMIDDHILDGDLVLVRPQNEVDDGEIAVALLDDGSATLKRVFRENGQVRLQPANETMQPIFAPHVEIQGKVVGVWRMCQ